MPQPKKKMGRPVLPKEREKSGRVQARLTMEEKKKIASAAKASKQTESDWIRSTLMAALNG